ncbi:MAG: rhodanese-like domain-containing protein [Helicobacteraceae bacterium]|nr:rhodanese-like domain-containing protein [Helicobacteraceae bacterium]
MKSLLILLTFTLTTLFAQVQNEYITQKLVDSKTKIIDIRTVGEWKETGLVKGSIPIEFFDIRGNYNIPQFLKELDTKVKKGEKFALICRTGSRTKMVSNFLNSQGYKVTNLLGGIMYAKGKNIKLEKYKGKK